MFHGVCHQLLKIFALQIQGLDQPKGFQRLSPAYMPRQLKQQAFIDASQHFHHLVIMQLSRVVGQALVKDTQRVPQGPFSIEGNGGHRCFFIIDSQRPADGEKPLAYFFKAQGLEREPQASGKNGGRNFVKLSGGQYEYHVVRRLLQGFKKRIEGSRTEHVYLINNIYLVAAFHRWVLHIFPDLTNVIHSIIGGGIDFQHIHHLL